MSCPSRLLLLILILISLGCGSEAPDSIEIVPRPPHANDRFAQEFSLRMAAERFRPWLLGPIRDFAEKVGPYLK